VTVDTLPIILVRNHACLEDDAMHVKLHVKYCNGIMTCAVKALFYYKKIPCKG